LEQTNIKHSVGGLIVRASDGLNLKTKTPASGIPETGVLFLRLFEMARILLYKKRDIKTLKFRDKFSDNGIKIRQIFPHVWLIQ
jgi:hypothetical protein